MEAGGQPKMAVPQGKAYRKAPPTPGCPVGAFGIPPPPRVFWKKRLEDVDLIGVDFFGAGKEAATVSE